jgi:hypothetical protein
MFAQFRQIISQLISLILKYRITSILLILNLIIFGLIFIKYASLEWECVDQRPNAEYVKCRDGNWIVLE